MTISVDSIAVDDLRMAASQGEHDRVISDSKAICKQLLNLHLQTLDIEARSYVACAKITQALTIATTMQQMAPASALGYLCEGYIHTQQGCFSAAARVYDTAFQHVPLTDPLYERLEKEKSTALERSSRSMDIIARLPNDVNYRIFELLFTGCLYEEYCQYLLVSSTWRQSIFQSGQLQAIIEDGVPFEETNPVIIESFQHVRTIEYLNCDLPFYMLRKEDTSFESLTSLVIERSAFGKVGEGIRTLHTIGSTLTTLVLRDYSSLDQPLYLNDILKSCPHLVSLACITNVRLSPLEDTYPALLQLTLHPMIQPIDSNLLLDILPRFPFLQKLDVTNVPTSMPITIINTSYRSLQVLRYGDSKVTFRRERFTSSPGHGLRKLDINNKKHNYSLEDILPLLISHHHTLETLFIQLHVGTSGSQSLYEAMNKNDSIRFSNLHTMHVKCMSNPRQDSLFLDMMAWVIQRAPFVKDVILARYAVYPPLMRALAQCVSLQSLATDTLITFPPKDRPDGYDQVFAQFIKDHVNITANHGGSLLQTIEVGIVNIDDMMVQSIGGLKSLRMLMLDSCHPIDASFVPLFEALTSGCHGLHTLSLRAGTYGHLKICNDVLYLLRACRNLQYLNTMADLSESISGTLCLIQCPRLDYVALRRSRLDTEVIQALKERIRDVWC
ncbi:predicted protein [Lichtheimia corymbifera JMRC:FSU:9682]|uniref:F-box domain-containing protein n=1 Tax=Lichtheimia corymbifera JMRC:FSU:9682 TaxID=1263082 RepID=A0A068SIP6_9FUNG|nr:predicted protein [Lichtheimia corymbifera JMRC:FSU:9682]